MIVKRKQEGSYIDYEQKGSVLTFRGGALEIDLAAQQAGYPVHIDVSADAGGRLVTGPAHRYVAEIDIPARVNGLSFKGSADDLGIVQAVRTTEPLDTEQVVLTLWAWEG
ncbi:MAG: hypothetical protein LBN12_06145 [Clostridiales Family XIII bacterium]|jgi:hypothetical protein|nr:hypothetical protein [Clostridiales Family XIII bacterium]